MEGNTAAAGAIDKGEVSGGGKETPLGLKLRRAISASKRGVLCTPPPSWKLEEPGSEDPDKGDQRRRSISARKLGAGLWEIQDPLPMSKSSRQGSRIRRHRRYGKPLEEGHDPSMALGHKDWPQSAGSLRRHVEASLNRHHNLNGRSIETLQPVSPASYANSLKISPLDQEITHSTAADLKDKFGDVGYSLKTSKEVVKVFNHIWSLEEQHESSKALVKALKLELEHAQARIQTLMKEQHAYCSEMDHLTKKVTEENILRRKKEQQKMKAAVLSIRDELEDERQLRRRSESLHRKLSKELSEAKMAFLKVAKDLDKVRKTNNLLEDLCDAFAMGIKDYEHEVRLLKQKSAKACDHTVDRLVLHISEAWLDEREQMKIAEAQGHLVDRTLVAERLQSEIGAFIQACRANLFNNRDLLEKDEKRDINLRRQSIESLHLNGAASAPQDADDDDNYDNDSVASDLHCFEINVGSGDSVSIDHLLDQNGQKNAEKLDSARKSTFLVGKAKSSERNQNHHISSCVVTKPQEERRDTKFCGNQMHLLNKKHGKHSDDNAESEGTEANPNEHSKPQVSGYVKNAHEGLQDMKMMRDLRHGVEHSVANPVKKLPEISECCNVDYDKSHGDETHDPTLSRGQLCSLGSGTGPGEFGNTISKRDCVDQHQHQTSDLIMHRFSSKQASVVHGNTLKTRLLEARLEGQQVRLQGSRVSSVGRTRQTRDVSEH